MKTKLFIAGAVLALTACNPKVDNTYTVTIDFGGNNDGAIAYMMDFDSGETIDSVAIADGKAVFSGSVDKPALARIIVDGRRYGMFILEADSITFAGGTAAGGELNKSIEDYSAAQSELEELYGNMYNQAVTPEQGDSIYGVYSYKSDSLMTATMEANIDNPIGYYLFINKAQSMEPADVNDYLAKYPQLKDYKRVNDVMTSIERKEATSAGKQYTDFEVEYDGTVQKLSDYVKPGQYTLVDFWASWCGPCRREIKVIKELYEKYASKGLNVVGVAVWDEPDNTKQAIAEDGVEWSQILNAQQIPTDLYGINGIPCIMLIGPDGTIIARDLFDDTLVETVTTAMDAKTE